MRKRSSPRVRAPISRARSRPDDPSPRYVPIPSHRPTRRSSTIRPLPADPPARGPWPRRNPPHPWMTDRCCWPGASGPARPGTPGVGDPGPRGSAGRRAERGSTSNGWSEAITRTWPTPAADSARSAAPTRTDSDRLRPADPVPVADVREYVLKPRGLGPPPGGELDHQRPGDARPGLSRSTSPRGSTGSPSMAGDSIGAGWGVDDGLGVRADLGADPRSRVAWERGRLGESSTTPSPATPPASAGSISPRRVGVRGPTSSSSRGRPPTSAGTTASSARSCPGGRLGRSLLSRGPRLGRRPARRGSEESYKQSPPPPPRGDPGGRLPDRRRRLPVAWRRQRLAPPAPGRQAAPPEDRARLVDLARAAGFTAVVDLSDAFDGLDPAALAIGPDDFHPNARGHAILARSARRGGFAPSP